MPLEDFQLKEGLGKGSFGNVVKCVRRSDGEVYAMKLIKLQKLKQKDKQNALNQIRFLASIQNPYVISYKEAFYDEKTMNLCIVMQYANEGDLHSKIKKAIANKTRIPEKQIWTLCYQVLEGLSKLHECNIIHRDVKPANIFFSNGVAKVGDLNVAKHLKDQFAITQTGTPYYASPEVWCEKPYDFKSDIWSLGCVLYQMAMLKPPFAAETPQKLYKKIILGAYESLSKSYSRDLSLMIGRLMCKSPKQRPGTKQLLSGQKMLQLKSNKDEILEQSLLQTIKFPTNMKKLNQKLPVPNYENKSKTLKNIDEQPNLKSSKKINIPSLKHIDNSITKNPVMSIKQLLGIRKPKNISRNGSQKLIF